MRDDTSNHRGVCLTEKFSSSAKRIVALDLEKYQAHLDGLDVSKECKEEFLRAMYSIVMTFFDLGFEVHPLQEVCGKKGIGTNRQTQGATDAVRLEKSQHSLGKPVSGPLGSLENK